MAVPNAPYRRILTSRSIENAIKATLNDWMNSTLREIEWQEDLDIDSIERPRAWTRKNTFDKWPDDNLPLIIVICSNLAGRPAKDGDGVFRAPWAIGIAAVVSSQDSDSTRDLAGIYAAAIREIMVNHQKLKSSLHPTGFPGTRGVDWVDERYGEIPEDSARTLAASRSVFTVEFDDVLTHGSGPIDLPDESPVEDWPEITDVNININKEAINAP